MTEAKSNEAERVRRFWDKYLKLLHKQDIEPPYDRWYVRRAEQYIAAFPDKRLGEQSPEDVDSYLAEVGREGALEDWQFRQVVDAIRNLFRVVGVDWLDRVDWGHWRDSARSLGPKHPTIARDIAPEKAGQRRSPLDAKAMKAVRARHAELLTALKNEIRRRAYSVRTEEAYPMFVISGGRRARNPCFCGSRRQALRRKSIA